MKVLKILREKQRDKVRQDPDIKDKKGTQPDVYYKGLKKSTKDKRDAHFKKGAKMDDDNPAAYKPAPGDANAKTKPSKHTKKFKAMFGETTLDMEEGKLVANFGDVLDVIMKKLKSEVGKRYKRTTEDGLAFANQLGKFVNAKVTDKKQQKNRLFLKFGEETIKEELQGRDVGYLIKRYRELDKLQSRLIRIRGADSGDMKKARDAVRDAKFAIMDLVEGNADVIVDEYDKMPDLDEGSTGLHFNYEKVDVKKVLKKVKGVTKKQAEIIASIPSPTLMSLIQQLSTLASEKEVEESLWKNIHNKRKRGERMRKPGEKGAPKPGDFKRARGEQNEERNYKKEYENYHSKPDQVKRRQERNKARRSLQDRKDIKGKDVHHKDGNPMNNDKSNLSVVSQKYNRTEPRLRNEVLGKDATVDDYIDDFQKSDAPQFKNKSAEKIRKMAVAAYLDSKEK